MPSSKAGSTQAREALLAALRPFCAAVENHPYPPIREHVWNKPASDAALAAWHRLFLYDGLREAGMTVADLQRLRDAVTEARAVGGELGAFAGELAGALEEGPPDVLDHFLCEAERLLKYGPWPDDAAPAATASNPPAKKPRRKRDSGKVRPLTPKQTEAVQIVGECKGNIAEAARRLGVDRKTIGQHYAAGLAKLGRAAPAKHATRRLPEDRRGQADVPEGADRRN